MTIRRFLSSAARLAYVRRKVLFEAAIEDLNPANAAIRINFRMGGEADLRKFNQRDHGYDEPAREFGVERLAAGDRLIIGDAPSGIAFYGWLMFGQMDLGWRAYRAIPSDYAYTYKLFTVPTYRGLRICPAYYGWLGKMLHSENAAQAGLPGGIRRVLSWVDSRHEASIRSHLHSGLHPAGLIWHVQLMFRNYFYVSRQEPGSEIRLGASSVKCGY